jgi:DNA-binding beta-propeller fold protein YncE
MKFILIQMQRLQKLNDQRIKSLRPHAAYGFDHLKSAIKYAKIRVVRAQNFFMLLLVLFIFLSASSPILNDKYDPTTLVFPTFLHTYGVRKATAKHLFLYMQNRVKVRDPQGIAATRLDVWDNPKETKDDDEITVYGVNSGQDVVIYNTSMTAIAVYGLYERSERRLNRPSGIAAHRSGEVYLADTGNNRVVHFFNPGRELKWVRPLGGMSAPRDVAISADRTVFVADTGNNRVLVFRDDKLVQSWDKLSAPSGVAATDSTEQWSYYKDNFAVVIDLDGQRLQKFSRNGRLLKAVNAAEIGKPNAKFMYAAIDYYSNVYVTDFNNHCVHKFDRELNYLTTFGRQGDGDKEFIEPRGIAIYKRFGQVLIDDRESAQYYWVGSDVLDLNAAIHQSPALLQLDYFLTETSYVTLEILDANGKVLAKPMDKMLRFTGAQQELVGGRWELIPVSWINNQRWYDQKVLQKTPPVASGKYVLRLTISATYSSYKYFAKAVALPIDIS